MLIFSIDIVVVHRYSLKKEKQIVSLLKNNKMEVKKVFIWAMVNKTNWPPIVNKDEIDKIKWIECLFPGISYYSLSGAIQVQNKWVLPVLTKLFPELIGVEWETIDSEETVELKEFLACNGYEHGNNPEWEKKFEALLAS